MEYFDYGPFCESAKADTTGRLSLSSLDAWLVTDTQARIYGRSTYRASLM